MSVVDQDDIKDEWSWSQNGWNDVKTAIRLGAPIVVTSSSKILQQLLVSVLLGRKQTVLLAAVSVASIFSAWLDEMVTSGSVQAGVLCGQAYGAGNFDLVGVWLQMQLLFMTCLFPFMLMLKFATGPILGFFGVPFVVAGPAGIYAVWSSFALVFDLWYNAVYAYYLAQGIVSPDAVINTAAIVGTSVLVWYSVYYMHMGIYGVAMSLSVKRGARFAALVLYCWFMGHHRKTWRGWKWRELFLRNRWAVLLGMSVPAMIGTLFEQAQWTINSMFAARLGPASSAAFDLNVLLFLLLFHLVWGLCQGFGMQMARELGAGRPNRAQGVTKSGALLAYGLVLFLAVVFYVALPAYALFGSTDPEVQDELMSLREVGALTIIMCGGVFMTGEVLIKQGRVGLVFATVTIGNYFIGIPISYFLAPTWGIWAIQLGSLITHTLVHAVLGYCTLQSDWRALSDRARMHAEILKAREEPKGGRDSLLAATRRG